MSILCAKKKQKFHYFHSHTVHNHSTILSPSPPTPPHHAAPAYFANPQFPFPHANTPCPCAPADRISKNLAPALHSYARTINLTKRRPPKKNIAHSPSV